MANQFVKLIGGYWLDLENDIFGIIIGNTNIQYIIRIIYPETDKLLVAATIFAYFDEAEIITDEQEIHKLNKLMILS